MKKVLKWIGIIVGILVLAIVIANVFFKPSSTVPNQQDNAAMMGPMMYGTTEVKNEVVETEKGIVYNGKVIPVETYYYTKDPTLTFNDVYVKEGDIIEAGATLFDYKIDNSIDAQIDVLQKDFLNLQQQLDDYYTRVENFKTELAAADQSDTVYINYLKVELNNAEKKISEIKVSWTEAEAKINKLKETKKDSHIYSDISGLVYKVNENNSVAPSNLTTSAYIVLYSTQKMVRISVSEFEYKLVHEGQDVNVSVESLGKEYTCKVLRVDTMPNNLETEDTSYYNVEIAIPEEVPYGYSAVVTVPRQ
ncbi:efflux RND transporter periplasmic adaptor subunit [Anaerorhabdus sp.]|uniref:efflux RND transporter periplasmic adaptor subunit n=1 Tax=Anaerorhabdus sp. TaxID=1872524 RepID=UPI002FC98756